MAPAMHDGHVDLLAGGHLHHRHEDHGDAHGPADLAEAE